MFELPDLTNLKFFPYPEGKHIELKLNSSSCKFSIVRNTICAFLNSEGGYLIFGVDEKDRYIHGIFCDAHADRLMRKIDCLFNHKHILSTNTTFSNLISSSIINVRDGVSILVITVKPDPMKNIYKLKDGSIVYRVLASNYIEYPEEIVNEMKEKEMKQKKRKEKEETIVGGKIEDEKDLLIKELLFENKILQNKYTSATKDKYNTRSQLSKLNHKYKLLEEELKALKEKYGC